MTLRYRLHLEPDDDGTVLATSPDLPIVTFGEDEPDAIRQAADAIDVVIDSMVAAGDAVPMPTFPDETGEAIHRASLQTELKVRLHNAMLAVGVSRTELAARLGWSGQAVDRLFRLGIPSRIEQLETAFAALGKTLAIEIREAA